MAGILDSAAGSKPPQFHQPEPPPQRYRCPKGHEVDVYGAVILYPHRGYVQVAHTDGLIILEGEKEWRCGACLREAKLAWLKSVAPIMEEVNDATNN